MVALPELEFAFETRVDVGPILDVGQTPQGHRRIVAILGGAFEGPDIKARVLPGADWQILRPDGVLEIEAHYALETDDGALITIVNKGLRVASPEIVERMNRGEAVDPERVYFRTVPRFETAAPQYAWMTRAIFVGSGRRLPEQVSIRFWRVL
jgi:hypothetical protein